MHFLFWISLAFTLLIIPLMIRAYQTRATPARQHFYELAAGLQALLAIILWGCAVLLT